MSKADQLRQLREQNYARGTNRQTNDVRQRDIDRRDAVRAEAEGSAQQKPELAASGDVPGSARRKPVDPAGSVTNPRAKETEGKAGMAEVKRPRKTQQPPAGVSSRLRAGRTAQDPLPNTERVAIQSSEAGVQESPVSIPDYNGVKSPALVTAHGLSGKSCPLSRSETGASEAKSKRGGRPLAKDADKALERTKPWEAEGISRRTWYRRKAEERGL